MTTEQPLFPHDCPYCTYLGKYQDFDLYTCPQPALGLRTFIDRYGSAGIEYSSFSAPAIEHNDSEHMDPYKEALNRWKELQNEK